MLDFYRLQREQPEEYIRIISKLMDQYLGYILIFDKDDRIVFMSDAVCRDLGCDREEVLGQHKSILTREGYTERSASEFAKRSGKQALVSVKALKTNEVMFSNSTPVFDEAGELRFIVNRSETEQDLIHKMNVIYEERGLMDNQYREQMTYHQGRQYTIVAKSPASLHVFGIADEIARRDSAVMLTGEPGVGKEVLARYIHQNSSRAGKPFLPVNCSAIPSELMESEFFGYERGSFTGADRNGKPGLFELANGGTLFLDEIGELPLVLQPKLLRVLDSGDFRRIGGHTTLQTDVRIIAATNRDLRKMVEQNLFREDLFYRLNIIPIRIPPLRERKEDICELANQFLSVYNRKYGTDKKLSIQAQEYLTQYSWPGNIRELKNMMERLATISRSDIISLKAPIQEEVYITAAEPPKTAPAEQGGAEPAGTLAEAVRAFEEEYIQKTVERCGGNVTQAAKELGIHRSAIYRKRSKGKT